MGIQVLFTILTAFLLLSSTLSEFCPPNVKSWCSQTPYPQPCRYLMCHHPHSFAIKQEPDEFKRMSMQIALDQTLQVQSHAIWKAPKSQDKREKAALADCIELYGNTIIRFNHIINNYGQYTNQDVQTWLSAALTNLKACHTGFTELGVQELIPLMSHNVSKAISNALAIHMATPSQPKHEENFPTSIFSGDRKHLHGYSVSPASQATVVVAQDGSGDFKKIQEAVDVASQRKGNERFVIYVKAGTYKEKVVVGHKGKNITMVGDGIGKTIVKGSRSVKGGSTTSNSATVAITGDGFIARDMTFRNTAGPSHGQAVALRSGSDFSVFYRCSFEGYQDTLYVHSNRQFYRECDIYGTIDFIFGNAAVVFQNCNIYTRTSSHKTNTITAQSRATQNENSAIVIQNSRVTAAPGNNPIGNKVKTFLGRPWRKGSRTVFLKTFLDNFIDPAGWLDWNNYSTLNILYYGEFDNNGPGSSTANRVKWGGYHVITSSSEALQFSVKNLLSGDSWLPSSNVPYNLGL